MHGIVVLVNSEMAVEYLKIDHRRVGEFHLCDESFLFLLLSEDTYCFPFYVEKGEGLYTRTKGLGRKSLNLEGVIS